jgi:glycosyltransferase involved in cell wall biosynthesis
LLIGHGIYTLPILSKFSSTTKTIFNAHEFYLKEFEENEVWVKYSQPYYNYILNKYYKHIHITFCVSKIISDEYAKIFDVKSIEINNATGYQNLSPIENKEIVKIIHHGGAIRTRQIEIMINAINLLPKTYQLYLMLVKTDKVYYDELLKYKSEKIFFIEPVAVEEIAKKINNYDIGLFILPPINYNWLNALPNKLFEFIQARLCVVVSPNPDMKRIVESNKVGIVTDNYSAQNVAENILKLTNSDILMYKQNSHKTAKLLNAEKAQKIMLMEVQRLLDE